MEYLIRLFGLPLRLAISIVALASGATLAQAQTVSTSFEGLSSSNFTIGQSPATAQFTGGRSQTIGNRAFYRTGRFSWHVLPLTSAMVVFDSPAEQLSFWFRLGNTGSQIVARIIDTNGDVILQQAGTSTFTQVELRRTPSESAIARIEFINDGTRDSVVDDFEFIAREVLPPDTENEEPAAPEPGLANPLAETIAAGDIAIDLTPVLTGLAAPHHATYAPNHPDTLYIVDQIGQIQALNLQSGQNALFLDLTNRLVPLGVFGAGTFDERGLIGFAFHPDYATNGLIYTHTSEPVAQPADFTTLPDPATADHQSVISEWQVTNSNDAFTRVDLNTRRELMRIDQPQFNHNGGALAFDAAGLLYIALGDGGGADDADGQEFFGVPIIGHGLGNAQNPGNPFGSLLRIDPLGGTSANGNYAIPLDNPFIAMEGVVQETFAYGFRNPFRMAFDRATGRLWLADVGQNDIEEVNIVDAGGNYGWNLREGSFAFNTNGLEPGFVTQAPSQSTDLIDPVAQYDHDEGLAVIGGEVYRGNEIAALAGRYVFGDFGQFGGEGGRLFYLNEQNVITELRLGSGESLNRSLNGIGADANGELYVLANTTGQPSGSTGAVYRLALATTDTTSQTASDSGGGQMPVAFLSTITILAGIRRRRQRHIKPSANQL